ncbi:MAG: lytic murein transglycosylase [Hydrogenophilaceae bacterium]|nr:lytic murein transglycosylase [Hydrogenophilaceae bacterium]
MSGIAGALLFGAAMTARADASLEPGFIAWLGGVQDEALRRGISEQTWQAALPSMRPIERVLELDQKQPEFVDTFWNYLDARVNDQRIAAGGKLLHKHRKLLQKIETRYGVPARVLVAFWGLETHYGKMTGRIPITGALATLAYDARRTRFFRNELLDALAILQAGHVEPKTLLGSWAGAMGQVQFMPSTFNRYAVDADGDGRKDIWGSLDDAFASAANYLRQSGWQPGQSWGRPVQLPPDFDWQFARLDVKKPLSEWAALGISQIDGAALPDEPIKAALLLPQGHTGPAFLVYGNFEVMLTWNRSVNYALAVGHLADRLNGQPALSHGRDADNRRLSREQAIELQQRLVQLGFNVGDSDGVLGSRTRAAIRAYQRSASLPADGYPSLPLLQRLQATGTQSTSQAALSAPAANPIVF